MKVLEAEFRHFIHDGNPNIVDETTRKMAVKEGGFGIPNINIFWKSIRMSWLRRLIGSESTWAQLHRCEVNPFSFNPRRSNFVTLSRARNKTSNHFWKDVYSSLIECRMNVLLSSPQEFRYIPINGEPLISSNKFPIKQEWATGLNLDCIIDEKGNFHELGKITCPKQPFEYEFGALKSTVKDFIDVYSGGKLGVNTGRDIRSRGYDDGYNIYGRLVTRRKKGCSYYYTMLNIHAKTDGWTRCSTKLEADAEDAGFSWECDVNDIVDIVKQVNRTPYYNRLKQFFLRLLRNNLFFGKTKHNASPVCVICGQHPEKRIPALLICKVTTQLVKKLMHALREASLLRDEDTIECFLFRAYNFNSVQNISLVLLWDFMYKARFQPEKYLASNFFNYLRKKLNELLLLTPVLTSEIVSFTNALLK